MKKNMNTIWPKTKEEDHEQKKTMDKKTFIWKKMTTTMKMTCVFVAMLQHT